MAPAAVRGDTATAEGGEMDCDDAMGDLELANRGGGGETVTEVDNTTALGAESVAAGLDEGGGPATS
jgi:hypothetical protein